MLPSIRSLLGIEFVSWWESMETMLVTPKIMLAAAVVAERTMMMMPLLLQ
jgi:hypothetical protein